MRAQSPHTAAAAALRVVVAIPARDEALRIGACLDAITAQRDTGNGAFDFHGVAVLVLANCCRDDTAARARAMAARLPFSLIVVEAELPPDQAHAGGARRLAMATAATLVADDAAALLTTDADARPDPRWLAANLAALAAGADAVAGCPIPDPDEFAALPPALRRRERREAHYATLLEALGSALDPEPHDPWPRHGCAAGASIGVTRAALRRVGGVPAIPSGEDRALMALLEAAGARIRHCPAAVVRVSCRLDGRAGGGMAATLRQRNADPAAPVDDRLEPALDAWRRGRARSLLRQLRAAPDPTRIRRLAASVSLSAAETLALVRQPSWPAARFALDASPGLAPRPVTAASLPMQSMIAAMLVCLARLRGSIGDDLGWLRGAVAGARQAAKKISQAVDPATSVSIASSVQATPPSPSASENGLPASVLPHVILHYRA